MLDTDEPFAIPPGQFAFILTEEIVSIPPETMGFISIRATYKLNGLVNVSGFHVDPGWTGPLIFSVFNAGPAPVHLSRGLPIFLLWVANLDEVSEKHKTNSGPSNIPPKTINNISGVVDSVYALEGRLRDDLNKLTDKTNEMSDRLHHMDKAFFRVMVGLSILGTVLVLATGVVVRSAVISFIDPPAAIDNISESPTSNSE